MHRIDSQWCRAAARGLLAIVAAGLAPAVPAADDRIAAVGEAMAAAAACARAERRTQEIRINPGVYTEQAQVFTPLSVELPLATDPQAYAECMRRAGHATDVARTAWFELLGDCRQRLRRLRIGVDSQGNTRIGGDADAATLDACLRGELSDIEVEVELPQR